MAGTVLTFIIMLEYKRHFYLVLCMYKKWQMRTAYYAPVICNHRPPPPPPTGMGGG